MGDFDRRMLLGAAGLVGVAALSRVAKGGPLNPPAGPVTGTGKTLNEVEPRKVVSAANTPGDSTAVFVISQPGSYYLAGNVDVPSGKCGVRISVSNVTLDLNGFQISGSAAGGGGSTQGVVAGGIFLSCITVRNGVVRQMGSAGIALAGVAAARVEDVTASGNVSTGVNVGDRSIVARVVSDTNTPVGFNSAGISAGALCVVTQCIASNNVGIGIVVGDNSVVSECVATGNQAGGIGGGSSAVFIGCTAMGNTGNGIGCTFDCVVESCTAASNTGRGITAAFSSTITNCTARANTIGGILATDNSIIEGCTSAFNSNGAALNSDGITFGKGCMVKNCTANSNSGSGIVMLTGAAPGNGAIIQGCGVHENLLNGIVAGSDSLITDNKCSISGTNGGGGSSNMIVNGSRNRIERNHASSTSAGGPGYGINVAGSGNLIFGNSSAGAASNWSFGTVNVYGPIVDRRNPPIVGALGSGPVPSTMGTTDPFANISMS